jgi:dethiobiotin synthetase
MTDASSEVQRIVVLGTGTGVGKTWLSAVLLRALRERGRRVLGLKPVESGVTPGVATDADLLAAAGSFAPAPPPFALPDPISPHLAARRTGREIRLGEILTYVQSNESSAAATPLAVSLVETAGGLLTPLAPSLTNFDLARALEPARWLLVAPDSLGVLHDVSAALAVCDARGRPPDAIALCGARPADASTGTNASEIATLGIASRPFVFSNAGQRSADLEGLLARLAP